MSGIRVGNRKGHSTISEDTKAKANRLFILGGVSDKFIAAECGISTKSFYTLKTEGKWEAEKKKNMQLISQSSVRVGSDGREGINETESDVRKNLFRMSQIIASDIDEHLLEKDKRGRLRRKQVNVPDLERISKILERVQKIQFKALGIGDEDMVPKDELGRIVNAIADIINHEVSDIDTRKRIVGKIAELEG